MIPVSKGENKTKVILRVCFCPLNIGHGLILRFFISIMAATIENTDDGRELHILVVLGIKELWVLL